MAVRLTEYTVGPSGPAAMPAELPPQSLYTYAVELSADEALAAGATSIHFDAAVPFYVDNFLGFPAGTIVPAGVYDPDAATWVAMENGIVIDVLSTVGDLAELDVDGSGVPAGVVQLAALGITEAERAELAHLYATGTSLWRLVVEGFSTIDCNWPGGPPPSGGPAGGGGGPGGGGGGPGGGGGGPGGGPGGGGCTNPKDCPPEHDPSDDDCPKAGQSTVDVQTQILRESVPVAGTSLSLHYASDRVRGRTTLRQLPIRLVGDTVPPMHSVQVRVTIAGKRQVFDFAPLGPRRARWGERAHAPSMRPGARSRASSPDFYR